MKKTFIEIASSEILLLAFILCLSACANDEPQYPWDIIESKKAIINVDENISLQVVEESLTASGMLIKISNQGVEEIFLGREYCIQILVNDVWYDIDATTDWTLELTCVEPNQKYEEEIEWSSYYGELPQGKYRIVKEYEESSIKSYIFSEFEIFETETQT